MAFRVLALIVVFEGCGLCLISTGTRIDQKIGIVHTQKFGTDLDIVCSGTNRLIGIPYLGCRTELEDAGSGNQGNTSGDYIAKLGALQAPLGRCLWWTSECSMETIKEPFLVNPPCRKANQLYLLIKHVKCVQACEIHVMREGMGQLRALPGRSQYLITDRFLTALQANLTATVNIVIPNGLTLAISSLLVDMHKRELQPALCLRDYVSISCGGRAQRFCGGESIYITCRSNLTIGVKTHSQEKHFYGVGLHLKVINTHTGGGVFIRLSVGAIIGAILVYEVL